MSRFGSDLECSSRVGGLTACVMCACSDGFAGLSNNKHVALTAASLAAAGIHHQAGTFLRTSRAPLDVDRAVRFIEQHGVNQVYVPTLPHLCALTHAKCVSVAASYIVGGDGSFHAAHLLAQHLLAKVRRGQPSSGRCVRCVFTVVHMRRGFDARWQPSL